MFSLVAGLDRPIPSLLSCWKGALTYFCIVLLLLLSLSIIISLNKLCSYGRGISCLSVLNFFSFFIFFYLLWSTKIKFGAFENSDFLDIVSVPTATHSNVA
jgi:hypothetical protein